MKPWSKDRSLSLPEEGEIEVSRTPSAGGICWLAELPGPGALPALLSCRQVWAPADLHPQLEKLGIPHFRLAAVEDAGQGLKAAASLRDQPVDLIWRGPFGRNSSLSTVNTMTVEALERRRLRVELQAVGSPPSNLEVPAVSQSWPVDLLPASAGPQVTFAPWEYFYTPAQWVESGPLCSNRWWTPSHYAKAGMVASGLCPDWIEVIPNGVDLEAFRPDGPALFEEEGKTVFLFVGGTIFRKGLDILMRAWDEAFSFADPVLLVIKDFGSDSHYAGQNVLSELEAWARQEGHAEVRVISDFISPEQMPKLYRSAQVGVFPYRGEGFCMPALEAMACGLPIIFPQAGPSAEYCREGGWALEGTPRRLGAPADLELVDDPLVHEVDPSELAQALREASDPDIRAAKGLAARREAQGFSWDGAAERAHASLKTLAGEGPVFAASAERPQGERLILACAPEWGRKGYHRPLARAVEAIAGQPATLALFAGSLSEEAAVDELLLVLKEQGADPEAADLTLVEADDFLPLALGADAVLLLDGRPDPAIGRPQVQAGDLAGWLEANSGS